jgi:hypothetical protein
LAQPTTAAARLGASVEVFPNPATEQLQVRVAGKLRTVTARLVDELGRVVQEQAILDGVGAIPVAKLPRGMYVLSLTGADGITSKQVLLQ